MRSFKILKITFLIIAGIALYALAIQLLWNWLLPSLFKLPLITFWQACGLMLLSKFLFGGFYGFFKTKNDNSRHIWRANYKDRMEQMSTEERAQFKQDFRSKMAACFNAKTNQQ